MIRYKRLKVASLTICAIVILSIGSMWIVPEGDRATIVVTAIGSLAGVATVFAGSDAYRKSEMPTNERDELP